MRKSRIKDWEEYGYTEEAWGNLTKQQRYKIRHPEKVREHIRKYANRNRQFMSDRQRKYQLRDKYGITEEDFDIILISQKGLCAICSTDTPTGKWKRFAVDHCHHTGQVRGLLCNECNRGIGLLKDNAELLRKAAEYLDYHKKITKEENSSRKEYKYNAKE